MALSDDYFAGRQVIGVDRTLLKAFKKFNVRIEDLDSAGRHTRTVAATNGTNTYRLRDRQRVPNRHWTSSVRSYSRPPGRPIPLGFTADHFGRTRAKFWISAVRTLNLSDCGAFRRPGSGLGPQRRGRGAWNQGHDFLRPLPGARLTDQRTLACVWSFGWMPRDCSACCTRGLAKRRVRCLRSPPDIDWSSGQGAVVWRAPRRGP